MKQLRFSRNAIYKRHTQRGDFLIESLIGVLLIGIVGVGIAHTARQVTKSQVQSQTQAQIISKLEGIASGGIESKICGDENSLGLSAGEYSNAIKYDSSKTCDGDGNINTLELTLGGTPVTTKQPIVMNVSITENGAAQELRVGQFTPGN